MASTYIQPAFSIGELSPSLYGRVDLQAFKRGAATLRNMFVDYRGGATSRPGTAFVGLSKQPGSAPAPRLIPFRFSLDTNFILEFGEKYMRVISKGAYVTEAGFTITAATQSAPGTITVPGHNFVAGDWIFISGVVGMTRLNNRTFRVASVSGSSVRLNDIFGSSVNATGYGAYVSGGTAARIYTLTTPYVASDLQLLKFSQSASVMTLTHPSYAPFELSPVTTSNWNLVAISFGSAIVAPGSPTVTTSNAASATTYYSYVVTAVDVNGNESIASPIGTVFSVNINAVLGTITITWPTVAGATLYNIYKAPASVSSSTPVGVLFGYAGTVQGLTFIDTNVTPDFTVTPPLHQNPFAIQEITSITINAGGSGYTAATTITVVTATGSGAVILPVILGGVLSGVIIQNGGTGYIGADTLLITDSGGGVGASATFTIGPTTGTFPGVVGYFQQRRVFANTNNNPDTYWMSKPGTPSNFDSGAISIDTDSIEGTPWAVQVQGIQSLVPMPGGLVVFTGLGVWQVNGGQPGAAMTPANQAAVPQAYNGAHTHIQPININFDIIYVQAKGAIVRDLAYNIFANIYTGTDISVLSNHLFEGHQIQEWAWAEEPFKLIWAVLDNGRLLSLTYLKEQEIQGWARHDTFGLFFSVAVVGEQPVDACYVVVQRQINNQPWYFIERFDNRLWQNIEDSWCFDAGAALPQPKPAANLVASATDGDMSIGAVSVLLGGTGYTDPSVTVVDPGGGSGAMLAATVSGGIITGITVVGGGSGYASPRVVIHDSTGSGASANVASIIRSITLTADADVFTSGNVGDMFRGGNGRGPITSVVTSRTAVASMILPITDTFPDSYDDAGNIIAGSPLPINSGSWTLTTPATTVYAEHLQNQIVCCVADGNLIQNILVGPDGSVVLPEPASNVVLGLPFVVQIQSMNAELEGEATIQGKRKNISGITLRVKGSRGIFIGSNQPNASQQENQVDIPWTGMYLIKQGNNNPAAGVAIPLFSGDYQQAIAGLWGIDSKPGQVCAQQPCGLPMQVLAFIPNLTPGDDGG